MSSRFLRDTIFGTVTALMTTVGGFLINVIVARLLGVSLNGSYTFALWVIAVSCTLTGAGIPFTLSRYLPEVTERSGRQAAQRLASFMLRPSFGLNLLPLVAALGYAAWLQTRSGAQTQAGPAGATSDPLFWILIGLCSSAQAISDFAKGYLRGMRSLDRVARLTTVSVAVQLSFIACGVVLAGLHGGLIGYFIGVAIPALAYRDFLGTKGQASDDLRRRIKTYTGYRWASEVAGTFVFYRIEILFLQLAAPSSSVGLFAAALTLSNLATQGPLMLTWGFLPHLSEQFGRNDLEGLRKTYETGTRLLAFLVFPCCFGLAAILPELLPLLYGSAFSGAVPAAMALVLAGSLMATASIGSNVIWAMEKSHVDLYFGLTGALCSLVVGLPIVMHFGLAGAVVARVVTQTLVIALGIWYVVSRLGFRLPVGGLVRIAFSALLCAVAARGVIMMVPGLTGLVLAIGAGALVYIVAVSLSGALEAEDTVKLVGAFRFLPRPLGAFAQRLVSYAFG